MNWIVKNFLRGLVIILPIALTIYLFYEAFVRLDRLLPLKVPGAGLAILIVLTVLVGALASNFFVRKFLQLADLIFTRAPIVDQMRSRIGRHAMFCASLAGLILDAQRGLLLA